MNWEQWTCEGTVATAVHQNYNKKKETSSQAVPCIRMCSNTASTSVSRCRASLQHVEQQQPLCSLVPLLPLHILIRTSGWACAARSAAFGAAIVAATTVIACAAAAFLTLYATVLLRGLCGAAMTTCCSRSRHVGNFSLHSAVLVTVQLLTLLLLSLFLVLVLLVCMILLPLILVQCCLPC